MSLKENVDFIKNEINTEEKFLVGFVKFERLYKKYKFLIILVVTVTVIGFIGNSIKNYIDKGTKLKANIAYNTLLKNPKDVNALAILKDSNKKLYDIIVFLNSSKDSTNIDTLYFKELSEYLVAIKKADLAKLNSLSINPDFLLKEYVIFNKALIETKNKEYKKAKQTLKAIGQNSAVSEVANTLRHYLITK